MTEACCDIIIPVFNALEAVFSLLDSAACFSTFPYKVLLIDDCSHEFAGDVLKEWCESRSDYSYIRNNEHLGFVKTVNRAIQLTTSEYVCILNSDTVVTNGWLEGLVSAALSDPSIAIVSPMTNNAPLVAVPIPPGYSVHMMAQRLANMNPLGEIIEVPTGVWSCWFFNSDIIRRFGILDEAFSCGYFAEADYSMRLRSQGYKIVTALNTFVFQGGRYHFGDTQDATYLKDRELFYSRWRTAFVPAHEHYCSNDPLRVLRKTLFDNTIPFLDSDRALENESKLCRAWNLLKRGEFRIVFKRARSVLSDIVQHRGVAAVASNPSESQAPEDIFDYRNIPSLASKTFFPKIAHCAELPRSEAGLRIVFLVMGLELCGGVTDLVQMVNQLALNGHDPIIATLDRNCSEAYANILLTRPLVFKNLDHLVDAFPQSDVVVATFWETAYYWFPRLAQRHHVLGAYYVQDFEPWFYPEGSEESQKAMFSYSLGLNVIAISDWIKGKLAELGQRATIIPIGIDLGIFYPRRSFRPKNPEDEFILTAMVRPDTPRRGFRTLVKMCEILHAQDPRMRFTFFGCDASVCKGVSFPGESVGFIENPDRVAEHLSSCDLLVDPSDFQGFGRCGLEAMACGLPTVLTNEGGTWEYSVHGENSLTAQAKDPEDFARRVLQIRRDPCLQERLSRGALETAKRFCHRNIGLRQSEYFQDLVGKGASPKDSCASEEPVA